MSAESAVTAAPEPAHAADSPVPPRFGSLPLVLLITLPVLALDQWSKWFVQSHMALYQDIALVPNYFDITYTQNPGAAFSMFTGLPDWFRLAFLATLATAAVVVLLVLMARTAIGLTSVAYALILAGAAGNLADRAIRGGRVIDFLRAHYYDLNWPVFNVADSAITVGVTLIVVTTLFTSSTDKSG